MYKSINANQIYWYSDWLTVLLRERGLIERKCFKHCCWFSPLSFSIMRIRMLLRCSTHSSTISCSSKLKWRVFMFIMRALLVLLLKFHCSTDTAAHFHYCLLFWVITKTTHQSQSNKHASSGDTNLLLMVLCDRQCIQLIIFLSWFPVFQSCWKCWVSSVIDES